MTKLQHEVRDGIQGFVLFDEFEKTLIDSAPVQRLRCINQLAMCYQVYPAATHKRFEHSVGVMQFATRIFDSLFDGRHSDGVQARIASQLHGDQKSYWKRVVRFAGLLHDVGHLPFSHAAESALLPDGWNHERLTAEIIRNSEIADLLNKVIPVVQPEDVIDVAWDVTKRIKHEPTGWSLGPWKTLLNEIICGNTFGADRIDYLMRDSWHAGVAYGKFDPVHLIAGLTPVIHPETEEIALGLDIGAIHTAESLLMARFFMYSQVYFHDVRRVYDLHLKEFLQVWLPEGTFSTNWQDFLKMTDHEVLAAMRESAEDEANEHHELAARVLNRKHFRTAYEAVAPHKKRRPSIFNEVLEFANEEFGSDNVRSDKYNPEPETNDFLVLLEDDSVESSLQVSSVIANVPRTDIDLIFVAPDIKEKAKSQIAAKVRSLLPSDEETSKKGES